MPDILTKAQRSYNMSKIRGKNTKAELRLRRLLFENGIRNYRLNSSLPGKPDIIFPKKKIAIFVDGCFWHKCSLHFVEPKTRTEFWLKKIDDNVKRDKEVTEILKQNGWQVLRFWEHEIKEKPSDVVTVIVSALSPK